MYPSASREALKEISEDLIEISSDIYNCSVELNSHEEKCDGCGLMVKENFQQYLWKKNLTSAARKVAQISQEIHDSMTDG